MPTLSNDQHYTFIAEGRTSVDLVVDAGSMASVSIRRSVSEGSQQKYYESATVTGIYPGDTVTIAAESGSVTYTVTNLSAVYSLDPTTGSVVGLVGPDGGAYGGIDVLAYPYTSDGIDSAIAKVLASGKPGTVRYAAADYVVTRDHAIVSGVSHVGVPGVVVSAGNVPDQDFTVSGGTRWVLSAGVTGLKWNNVNKGSDETNIATFAATGFRVYGISFIGGAKAIDTGALRAMGVTWARFEELVGLEQTSDYAFDFKNFQHCWFDRIYTGTQLTTGSGIRFASMLSDALLPGNSEFGEIYTYCKNRNNRGIVFEATGPSGCVLNQLKVQGRLQGNRYGAGTPDSISCTFTSGQSAIGVPNASLLAVGAPIVFDTTVPTGFTTFVIYFILSRDTGANAITLGESPYDTTPVTAGASGTHTAKYSGFPSVQFHASSGNSIKNSDFGQLDCEAFGNVAALVVAKTRNCKAFLSEVMTSATTTAVVTRDAEISMETSGGSAVTMDQSAQYGWSSIWSAPRPFVYSGGSFTIDNTWNGRRVRYTGTSDITITVPNSLPKGFAFEITPTGASGIVTFAAASGGAVFASGSKLRTLGQYANARLTVIANKVCSLAGDLQV